MCVGNLIELRNQSCVLSLSYHALLPLLKHAHRNTLPQPQMRCNCEVVSPTCAHCARRLIARHAEPNAARSQKTKISSPMRSTPYEKRTCPQPARIAPVPAPRAPLGPTPRTPDDKIIIAETVKTLQKTVLESSPFFGSRSWPEIWPRFMARKMGPIRGPKNGPDSWPEKWSRFLARKMVPIPGPFSGLRSGAVKWATC